MKTYHHVVRVAVDVTADTVRDVEAGIRAAAQEAGHVAADLAVAVADGYQHGAHVLGTVWHAVQSATSGVVHATTKWAASSFQAAAHVVKTAVHDVARAASATADFVKNHEAAIASVVTSTAVFVGCDAALGVATAGVGAVAGAAACGTLAGAVGNAVSYGITAAQHHDFSWSGLATSAAEGAAAGALGGALGGAFSEGIAALSDVASGLLSAGADADDAALADGGAAEGDADDTAAAGADPADDTARSPGTQETEPAGDGGRGRPASCLPPGRRPELYPGDAGAHCHREAGVDQQAAHGPEDHRHQHHDREDEPGGSRGGPGPPRHRPV